MSTDLTERKEPAAAVPEGSGLVTMMERLAANPDIPTEKLKELLDMQERILNREAQQQFAEAMTRVQAQTPVVARDKPNEQTKSRYARHETVAKAIKPIYTAEGFSLTFSEADSPKADHVRVVAVVRHKAGHSETHHRDIAVDSVGIKGQVNKTLTHAEASAFMYGRRYLTCSIFDVATDEDDDGNAAGGKIEYVTKEHVQYLEKLIKEAKVDRPGYLQTLGVETLDELPKQTFQIAKVALQARIQAKKSANGETTDA